MLALFAVTDQCGYPFTGFFDRRAMSRPEGVAVEFAQSLEASQVLADVSVGGNDYRGRPRHDVIATEDPTMPVVDEAQVISRVPRGMNHFQKAGAGADSFPVGESTVGQQSGDVRFAVDGSGSRAACFFEGGHPKTEPAGQRFDESRVILVPVGDQYALRRSILERLAHDFQVIRQGRSGVDDYDVPVAEKIGAGTVKRHRSRIAGGHPLQADAERFHGCVAEPMITVEVQLDAMSAGGVFGLDNGCLEVFPA